MISASTPNTAIAQAAARWRAFFKGLPALGVLSSWTFFHAASGPMLSLPSRAIGVSPVKKPAASLNAQDRSCALWYRLLGSKAHALSMIDKILLSIPAFKSAAS